MTDIQLNGQSLTAASTSGTTAPAAGTSETWTVATLGAGIPSLASQQTYALVDATATAGSAAAKEIIRVTALTAGGTSITVTRGADSTTPVAHSTGATYNIVVVQSYLNAVANGVPTYALPVNPPNRYDNSRGIYNYKASNTRILEQGLSYAMNGGMSRHLIIGDSVSTGATSGVGTLTYDRPHNWSYMMRDMLATIGIPANGTGFVRLNDANPASLSNWDQRWLQIAPTGTWDGTSLRYSIGTAVGSTLTFVSDRGGSIFELGYRDDGTNTVTISVDGATSGTNFATLTTGSGAAGTGSWVKYRMPNLAIRPGSIIKITITATTAGFAINGGGTWFPTGGLCVDNVSQSGARAATNGGASNSTWADQTVGAGTAGGIIPIFKDMSDRRKSITGNTTAASAVFTATSGTFNLNDIGSPLDMFPDTSGIPFPPNTYVSAVASNGATTATMSQPAYAAMTGKTIRVGRDPHCVHIALGGNDMMAAGTAGIPSMVAGITTLRNLFPYSDCILHLENEPPTPGMVAAGVESAFQQAMYQLADTLDVPLYDWRDRAGDYTTAFNNGIMNDWQAHMNPAMYADLGASLAMILGGGSGSPQNWRAPTFDGDLVNKLYVDTKSYSTGALTSPALTTTDTQVASRNIPPNFLTAGMNYRATIIATLSAAATPSFRLRFGNLNTVADAALVTHSPVQAAACSLRVEVQFTVRTTGAAGTSGVAATNMVLGVAPTATNVTATAATPSINTTLNNYLSVSASTTAGTLTVNSCVIEAV